MEKEIYFVKMIPTAGNFCTKKVKKCDFYISDYENPILSANDNFKYQCFFKKRNHYTLLQLFNFIYYFDC